MKFLPLAILLSVVLWGCGSQPQEQQKEKKELKIVSLNGAITEILFELEVGDEIVGIDVTSTFPSETEKITKLGHVSQLNVEGVIAAKPTHVLALAKDLNPQIKSQLEAAKIKVFTFEQEFSIEGTCQLVIDVADVIDLRVDGENLAEQIEKKSLEITKLSPKPRVLFIYARGAGTLMVGGTGTPIEKTLKLAGAENAATGFEDYKPLTSEGVISANPDILLMFDSGAQSMGTEDAIFKIPGVAQTNAGKNKKLITMDGQLLSGFGPRIGEAIKELNSKLGK